MKRRPLVELTIDAGSRCKPQEIKAWNFETCLENDFEIFERLGRGSIGVVHHARRRRDGLEVALKMTQSNNAALVALEYTILKALDHPHIIKCYDCISLESMECEVLVFEHFAGKTLLTAKLHKKNQAKACKIFLGLLSAVAYLHERNIIHRDIKADNVLVSQDASDMRLIDFNTSRRVEQGETPLTRTGTLTWSAPEVWLGECPGKPNDVWGMGLCLHLMLLGKLPWSQDDLEVNAFTGKWMRYEDCLKQNSFKALSKESSATLQWCLESDYTVRAQAQSLLQSTVLNTMVAIAA